MTFELNDGDRVLIKSLGLKGEVVGKVLQDHNKGLEGELLVLYEAVVRGNHEKLVNRFPPADLERVLDN